MLASYFLNIRLTHSDPKQRPLIQNLLSDTNLKNVIYIMSVLN